MSFEESLLFLNLLIVIVCDPNHPLKYKLMPDSANKEQENKYIPDSGCFAALLPDEVKFLNENKSTFVYHRKETVCKEGGFSSGVKYIINGLVKVYIEGPKNRNIIVKILGPGDFIGLSSISGSKTYSYSASSLCESTVFMINREAIMELIKKNGSFALEMAEWYCLSYDKAYKKLATIGFKNLTGRMADTLLYLDQEKFRDKNVYAYLSRSCIADLAGVPMESAVRVLSEFDKNGIIELSGKTIKINEYERLKMYSVSG